MLGSAPVLARAGRQVSMLLLIVGLVAVASAARTQASADAGAFLARLGDQAIEQLTEPGLSENEKERRFRKLFNESFDVPTIGRFVLGRYWRRASKAEQQAFLNVFEDMMVFRFLPVFSDYSGEKLKIGTVRQFGDNPNYFNVTSEFFRNEGEPVQIDWRIRKDGDRFKILDVVAEGVSIAVTLRSEYSSVLKRNGGKVAELTKVLRNKMSTL